MSLASMAGCRGQQHPQQPSVLHQLYPGLSSLKEALLRLASAHGLREHLALELVRADDPAAYSKALLDSTLVSVASNAPPLPQRFSLQQHSSQAEVWCTPCLHLRVESSGSHVNAAARGAQVVKRAVEVLMRSTCRSSNVLCQGLRKVAGPILFIFYGDWHPRRPRACA